MYRCQLNFVMFCATSALRISWQHLNHLILFVCTIYWFHVHYHVRIILHYLGISFPHEDDFNNVKNSCFKIRYYNICDDYGVNVGEIWMNGDWFHTAAYGVFSNYKKTAKMSFQGNLAGYIITQYKVLTRKGIEKISKSIRAYVRLGLTSCV